MAEIFNSDDTEMFTASDGTEGWLGHAPTQEQLEEESRKQAESNESMQAQIKERQEKSVVKQPDTKELIDTLRGDFEKKAARPKEIQKPDTDEVISELREIFKD